jgi:predicted PurR-regulated permease PerM
LSILPINEEDITIINTTFRITLQGILITTIELFVYHTIFTWIILDIFNLRFVFVLSLLSGVITLFPIISPLVILVPANLLLVVNGSNFMSNIVLLNASYCVLMTLIDNEIYKKNVRGSNPYVTGMSFVMGMYAFGLKGLIYGPVILCISLFMLEIIKTLIK